MELIIIGSAIASFILGITVGYFVAKHNFANQQIQRDAQLKNTEVWVDYLSKLGGTK